MNPPRSATVASDRERGASIAEYALLVSLIAVVALGAMSFLGRDASDATNEAAVALGGEEDEAPASGSDAPPAGIGGGGGPAGPADGSPGGGTQDPGTPEAGDPPSGGDGPGSGDAPDGGDSPGTGDETGGGGAEEAPAPDARRTSSSGEGRWLSESQWFASASVVVHDSSGQPLDLDRTQIHYERVRLVRYDPDGPIHEVSDGNQVSNVGRGGAVDLTGIRVDHGQYYAVVGVRFTVTKVVHNDGSGRDPSDGHRPSITVVPPAR